ncbi:MAG: methylthioxylose transferase [Actinomycetota bacterium]|nr:methylthioxylose transferase [Actinomycetota bacterium]
MAIESLQNHVGPWQMWPLYALWEPSIGPRIVLVLAVVACGWFLHRHVMKVPRAAFLVIILAFSCVFAVAVAIEGQGVKADAKCCVAGGPAAQITAPFRDSDSYFANVPLVDRLGPRRFDQSYPQLDQPPYASLTIHALTHPPGAPLLLWASDEIVGESLLGVCLLMIFLGALSSIATYLIALEIYGERAARLAGLLFCVAPAIVLYLATSMDAVFMTIFAFDFAALVRAPRSNRWALVAGLLWAVALMFTFSAAAIAIVSVGIGLLSLRTRTLRDLAPRAVLVVAGLVGGLAILQVGLGIDTPAVWTATSAAHATLASTYRPYVYWVWANLIAFALVAGIPQTALVLSEVSSRWRAHSPGLETVTLATLIVLTVSNVFKGEVDHIWLFMMPLVLAVAGNRLHALTQDEGMGSLEVRRALGVSVLQTVALQVLLFTYW